MQPFGGQDSGATKVRAPKRGITHDVSVAVATEKVFGAELIFKKIGRHGDRLQHLTCLR